MSCKRIYYWQYKTTDNIGGQSRCSHWCELFGHVKAMIPKKERSHQEPPPVWRTKPLILSSQTSYLSISPLPFILTASELGHWRLLRRSATGWFLLFHAEIFRDAAGVVESCRLASYISSGTQRRGPFLTERFSTSEP